MDYMAAHSRSFNANIVNLDDTSNFPPPRVRSHCLPAVTVARTKA